MNYQAREALLLSLFCQIMVSDRLDFHTFSNLKHLCNLHVYEAYTKQIIGDYLILKHALIYCTLQYTPNRKIDNKFRSYLKRNDLPYPGRLIFHWKISLN